eukprot:ANDGO_03781.mRNA.1 Nucleolar complex protein 3 homolog
MTVSDVKPRRGSAKAAKVFENELSFGESRVRAFKGPGKNHSQQPQGLPIRDAAGAVVSQPKQASRKRDVPTPDAKPLVEPPAKKKVTVWTLRLLKERIATLCTSILSEPAASSEAMKELTDMLVEFKENAEFLSLVVLSLAQVFADICPMYKIADHSKEDDKLLSKEVRNIRMFEASVLKHYTAFVDFCLKRLAHKEEVFMVRAVGLLLSKLPHFNLVDRLAAPLVTLMGSTCVQEACKWIRILFSDNMYSDAAVQVVQNVAKRLRSSFESMRCDWFHVVLLESFESLKFTQTLVYSHSSMNEEKKKPSKTFAKKLGRSGHKHDAAKKSVEKEREDESDEENEEDEEQLEKDLKESSATMSKKEKLSFETKMLHSMVSCYFRVLQAPVITPVSASEPLLRASMRGIVTFGHLLNVDLILDAAACMLSVASGSSDVSYAASCRATALCQVGKLLFGSGAIAGLSIDHHSVVQAVYDVLGELLVCPPRDDQTFADIAEACAVILRAPPILRQLGVHRSEVLVRQILFAVCTLPSASLLNTPSSASESVSMMFETAGAILTANPGLANALFSEALSETGASTSAVDISLIGKHHVTGNFTLPAFEFVLTSKHIHPRVRAHSRALILGEDSFYKFPARQGPAAVPAPRSSSARHWQKSHIASWRTAMHEDKTENDSDSRPFAEAFKDRAVYRSFMMEKIRESYKLFLSTMKKIRSRAASSQKHGVRKPSGRAGRVLASTGLRKAAKTQ